MTLTLVYQVEKYNIPLRKWVLLHKEKRMPGARLTAKRICVGPLMFDRLDGKEILRQDERIGASYIYTALRVEDEGGQSVWAFDNGLSK